MAKKRLFRKRIGSPNEVKQENTVRNFFQKERPSLAKLVSSSDYDVIRQGEYFELMKVLAQFKHERETSGLSLADVAERSGIDRAALSRLENGIAANPTIGTLERYANAIGKRIVLRLVDNSGTAAKTAE
jgi:predicted transcriptional regulator